MSPNPVRLPLSPRQAEALAALLDEFGNALSPEENAALREVAGKLDDLKDQR